MTTARPFFPRPKVSDESHRVTTFELLFDLVFVFAFTQVSGLMAHSPSAIGIAEGLIMLVLLWTSWAAYGWLANQTHVDEGIVRVGMSAAMIAMFVIALVIPEAFNDRSGGLLGPLVLIGAYFVVRAIHGILYLIAAGDDLALRRQILRTASGALLSVALLLAGTIIGGGWQLWFWLGAVAADAIVIYATSAGGDWRVPSAAHWAERHGLIVILALGESVVAIGVGAANKPVSVPILGGVVLAIVLSICLWWSYFDRVAGVGEEVLTASEGVDRARLASDGYTYLHFPLIAGIVISALGAETAIAHVDAAEPFGLFGAFALLGGTSLYIAGLCFFWLRMVGEWKIVALAAASVLLALIPVAALLPPLGALALVVACALALVVVEVRRHRVADSVERG
jgi:low temperature requirement protein LtrA